MTVTAFATNDPLTAKIWSRDWIDSSVNRSYFTSNGFIGPDESNSIIWKRTELEKQKGDTIYLGNIQELTNAGITGDNEVENSEEELDSYDDSLIIDQVRNAVRLEGRMTEQRAATGLRKYIRNCLRNWMANKIDQDIFTALGSAGTRVFYGGTATATNGISSSTKLTTGLVSKLRANAVQVTPEIQPVMVDGRELWVLVTSIGANYDLKQNLDTDGGIKDILWYAGVRGAKNPLFTRASLYWDNVVIHEHRHIATVTNWGSDNAQPGATNLFLGNSAGAIGYAKNRIWKEKLFDYDNSPGICVGAIFGVTKLVFNSEDHATQLARTYSTAITEST